MFEWKVPEITVFYLIYLECAVQQRKVSLQRDLMIFSGISVFFILMIQNFQ